MACPGGQLEGRLSPNRCLWAGFYPVLGKKMRFYSVRLPCLGPPLPRGRVPLPGATHGPHGSTLALLPAGTMGLSEIPGTGSSPLSLGASWGCITWTIPAPREGMGGARSWGSHRPQPLRLALAWLRTGKGEEIACVQMVSVKRRRFLLSPPLSPVTSSVISV